MAPTALITGGAGYVGLRLARRLLKLGFQVVLFDIRQPRGQSVCYIPDEDKRPCYSEDGEAYEPAVPPGARFIQGDICDLQQVTDAVRGADVVFHIASYGMSGAESLRADLIYRVNVLGTQNVIDACVACGVTRLVYASTANTVFDGRVVKGGDESMPRLDPTKFWDTYCRTKAQADALILGADRTPVAVTGRGLRAGADREDVAGNGKVEPNGGVANGHGNGMSAGAGAGAGAGSGGHDDAGAGAHKHRSQQEQKQQEEEAAGHQGSGQEREPKGGQEEEQEEAAPLLRTCALRLCGIYGPGEARHLPRVVDIVDRGLCIFNLDQRDGSIVDWLHVQNLCDALIAAYEGLGPDNKCIAGGQAYFISDGQPVGNTEFLRPFIEGLGYPFPFIYLPYRLAFLLGGLMELLHVVLKPFGIAYVPLLNRNEVNTSAVTHWFRIDKARRELGYNPRPLGIEGTVQWFRERGYGVEHQAVRLAARRRQRRSAAADVGGSGGGVVGSGWAQASMGSQLLLAALLGLVMVVCLGPVLPGVATK